MPGHDRRGEDRRDVVSPRRGPAVAAASAGAGFTVLLVLVAVRWGPLSAFDRTVVHAVNIAMSTRPAGVAVARAVADAGSPVAVDVLTGAVTVGALVARRYRAALYVLAVRGVELAVETVVKNALDRPRPVTEVVLATASGASFPSGHTAGTAAFCVSVLLLARPALRARARAVTAMVAVVAVVAVGSSRVLLGVHYPSDVVGGALLGVLCATAVLVALPARRPDVGGPPRAEDRAGADRAGTVGAGGAERQVPRTRLVRRRRRAV